MRRPRRLSDPREAPWAAVTEDFATPSVVASRRCVYEEAIGALQARLDDLLRNRITQVERAYVAWRGATMLRTRSFPKGAFRVEDVYPILERSQSRRAPQRLSPKHRVVDLDQELVNPLRRFYEFPATWLGGRTTYLRQLTIEERRVVVLYALTDYARNNPTKLRRLEHSDEILFVVPSRHHVEEAPSSGPRGPFSPAREPAPEEPGRDEDGGDDLASLA